MAWHDTIDSLKQEDPAKEIDEANFDRCITQRIELMLTKARSGQSSLAMEHAKWLFARAERMVSESGRQGQVGPFFAKDLYLQAGAALAIMAEFMPTNNQPAVIVKALESVKKAIDNGFRDADYLRHDPDLDALQGLEAYQELLAKLSQASEESTSNR